MDGVGDDVTDVLVGQGIDGFPAAPLDADQPCAPQDPQVMGHQGLAHLEPLDQLVDEPGLLCQLGHDSQPGRGGQDLEQLSCGLLGPRPSRHQII